MRHLSGLRSVVYCPSANSDRRLAWDSEADRRVWSDVIVSRHRLSTWHTTLRYISTVST